MAHFFQHVLIFACCAFACLLGMSGVLHLIPRLGRQGRKLSDALCRAPLLDLLITHFVVAPLIVGPILFGWAGLLGAILGQVASLLAWIALHELANRHAVRGPRIVKVLNRLVGRWRNHLALWWMAPAAPGFWLVRVIEIVIYPPLCWLVGLPKYDESQWVNVSRHKFSGLVGHDLIWCFYCDWMTGVWSLGSEMLRNIESFWCPIRFSHDKKCENCRLDFPDVEQWVGCSGSMQQVAHLLEEQHSNGTHAWFGHPVRVTVKGKPISQLVALILLFALFLFIPSTFAADAARASLKITWKNDFLTIRGGLLGEKRIRVHYLEAYCRSGSTHREWKQTVIPHRARLLQADPEGHKLVIEDTLADGVLVRHEITASSDEVDFRVVAHNPTTHPSEAQWAQPCIRVGPFAGFADNSGDVYLPKCFIFLTGKLARMPTPHWATKALYTPGQVWCPKMVSREDVNPRPLSEDVPSNGLIGCFSADEKTILATAWEPYQELFQGVIACIHSDFRIGGLQPGETKVIRGKIYIVPADVDALLARYAKDFPQQMK